MAAKKLETAILIESVGTVPVGQENLIRIINENHQGLLREFQQMDERLTRIENEVNGTSASLTLASIQSARNTNRTLTANENIAPVPKRRRS